MMVAALVCLLCLGSWYLGKTSAYTAGTPITQSDETENRGDQAQSMAEADEMLRDLLSGVPDTSQLSESVKQYGVELRPETAFYTTNLGEGERLFLPVTTFHAVPADGTRAPEE